MCVWGGGGGGGGEGGMERMNANIMLIVSASKYC